MTDLVANIGTTPPTCVECAYDLTGLATDGACPECGCPIKRSTSFVAKCRAAAEPIRVVLMGILATAIGTPFVAVVAQSAMAILIWMAICWLIRFAAIARIRRTATMQVVVFNRSASWVSVAMWIEFALLMLALAISLLNSWGRNMMFDEDFVAVLILAVVGAWCLVNLVFGRAISVLARALDEASTARRIRQCLMVIGGSLILVAGAVAMLIAAPQRSIDVLSVFGGAILILQPVLLMAVWGLLLGEIHNFSTWLDRVQPKEDQAPEARSSDEAKAFS